MFIEYQKKMSSEKWAVVINDTEKTLVENHNQALKQYIVRLIEKQSNDKNGQEYLFHSAIWNLYYEYQNEYLLPEHINKAMFLANSELYHTYLITKWYGVLDKLEPTFDYDLIDIEKSSKQFEASPLVQIFQKIYLTLFRDTGLFVHWDENNRIYISEFRYINDESLIPVFDEILQVFKHIWVKIYLKYAMYIARTFSSDDTTSIYYRFKDDIKEEAVAGLAEGIDRFDPRRGTIPSSYITHYIKIGIQKLLMHYSHVVSIPLSEYKKVRMLHKHYNEYLEDQGLSDTEYTFDDFLRDEEISPVSTIYFSSLSSSDEDDENTDISAYLNPQDERELVNLGLIWSHYSFFNEPVRLLFTITDAFREGVTIEEIEHFVKHKHLNKQELFTKPQVKQISKIMSMLTKNGGDNDNG